MLTCNKEQSNHEQNHITIQSQLQHDTKLFSLHILTVFADNVWVVPRLWPTKMRDITTTCCMMPLKDRKPVVQDLLD